MSSVDNLIALFFSSVEKETVGQESNCRKFLPSVIVIAIDKKTIESIIKECLGMTPKAAKTRMPKGFLVGKARWSNYWALLPFWDPSDPVFLRA